MVKRLLFVCIILICSACDVKPAFPLLTVYLDRGEVKDWFQNDITVTSGKGYAQSARRYEFDTSFTLPSVLEVGDVEYTVCFTTPHHKECMKVLVDKNELVHVHVIPAKDRTTFTMSVSRTMPFGVKE